jgi:CheY-like chemotaxis protein
VRDTGRGIPAGEIQHLFKPFYQATNNNQASGGVGLGLYISQRIVRLLGGTLEVSSKEGEGSNFWFGLPAGSADSPAPNAPTRRVVRLEGKATRLLVVDDDPANRQYMLDLLQEVGLSPTFASSGAEALHIMSAERFDCVISDIRMPGMSGIEFCRELRKNPRFAGSPVIASSASVYENDRETALSAGFDAFIPKPINEAALFALFELLLKLKPVYRSECESAKEFEGADDAINRPIMEALPDNRFLEQLMANARLGDIVALRSAIRQLNREDSKYRTFSKRLTVLAEQYQMAAIEKVLLAAMKIAPPPL